MTEPLLYTPAQAADLLQVTENWLTDRVSANVIRCTRLGRYIRFSRADLDLLIEQSTQAPIEAPRLRSAG